MDKNILAFCLDAVSCPNLPSIFSLFSLPRSPLAKKKFTVIYCGMAVGYGYVVLFLIFAIGFALITILLPKALQLIKVIPHHPSKEKGTPFECGMNTIGKTWVQFNFRFYIYALSFLVFDVLVIFLYPWAVSLRTLGGTSLIAIFILLAIVIVGYIYARKKGALEWN